MRQLFLSAAIALLGFSGPALAQQNPFSAIVYVNGSAVTQFELDQRIRFMQLLRAPGATPAEAEKALIEDRLRVQAAKNLGLEIEDSQIEAGLAEFAGRANMDTETFTAALEDAGVARQTYRDFVSAGVAWRQVVRARFGGRASVSDEEIDRAMKKLIETPLIEQVLISELIIPAPQGQEAQVEAQAAELRERIASDTAFAQAARQYSAAPSKEIGGRLQWMPVENLPPSLRPIILSLKPGQVSQPLSIPGAVVLFYLRDVRGGLRPGAENQLIDYARAALPSAQDAANVVANIDTCDDLFTQARKRDFAVQRDTLPQEQIPQDIALRLASLDENEAVQLPRGAAAELLMLCKRVPALLADVEAPDEAPVPVSEDGESQPADINALPERAAVRDEILNRKITAMANSYMADLRADAIIRRP